MIDFTSALYLGLHHGSDTLPSWPAFSTGRPAALQPPLGSRVLADRLAQLMGCAAATLAPSTLHLFWDLFRLLAEKPVAIYLDSEVYPIVRWGVERAANRGVPVRVFRHHDGDALGVCLQHDAGERWRPVVVTDGFCPNCGESAPLEAYLNTVCPYGGMLVFDDTQALGILGEAPGSSNPYGIGGGGSLRWWGIKGPDIISIASLAKGFGVPLAVLSGSRSMVGWFEARSETRVHNSPPAIPILLAAEHSLATNRAHGDRLRRILVQRVTRLRRGLAKVGLATRSGFFPVQRLARVPGLDVAELHGKLWRRGVRTVLLSDKGRPAIGFLITARHSAGDIDEAVGVVARLVRRRKSTELEARGDALTVPC